VATGLLLEAEVVVVVVTHLEVTAVLVLLL
jgi:hypothetical protein